MKSRLSEFLSEKMSMTEIYQPVIIKELLRNGGECTKTDLAVELSRYDLSILDYYKKIVMRWPKDTLTKHNIVTYQRKGEVFRLNEGWVDLNQPGEEIATCEEKINGWIERKKNLERSPQASQSVRYEILKRAKGRCELCGIPSSLRPIDIDHIVPQSKKNKKGKVLKDGNLIDLHSEENLQALCSKCNRAKRATDSTDFRRTKKLVRDKIPSLIISEGRNPKVVELSGRKLILALNEKLIEEHEEYIAEHDKEKSVGELADMLEVIFALAKQKGYNREKLLAATRSKREKNGGFGKGFFYEGDED